MTVRKAVISAAGFGTRMLPATRAVRKEFFPIVDADGTVKPVIQMIVEEAVGSGIEEIAIVTAPGGDAAFRDYFSAPSVSLRTAIAGNPALETALAAPASLSKRITCITQPSPDGYGDAVRCAGKWANGEPVLVMLGDHLYVSQEPRRCARQLLDAFERLASPLSGVIRKGPDELHRFGTVYGERDKTDARIYRVHRMTEKPDIAHARRYLRMDTLPPDTFLCFFGLHVVTPDLFDVLEHIKKKHQKKTGEMQFTTAQAVLAQQRPYFACEIAGDPYDTGAPDGYARTVEAFFRLTSSATRSQDV
ncbi:MAG: NTP transferase domain-containing protein [candidate division Zixibacteria bacterium]|nr:NTP transferase domain-containing protein [candidate division Zixibacteria bacterium]